MLFENGFDASNHSRKKRTNKQKFGKFFRKKKEWMICVKKMKSLNQKFLDPVFTFMNFLKNEKNLMKNKQKKWKTSLFWIWKKNGYIGQKYEQNWHWKTRLDKTGMPNAAIFQSNEGGSHAYQIFVWPQRKLPLSSKNVFDFKKIKLKKNLRIFN